jgi:AmmeMemoRadiSam system protein A
MNPYTSLARASLTHFLENGSMMPVPKDLPSEMYKERRGVFVSWHAKDHRLRGCIGTIQGVHRNIAEEIIENAVSSGTEDYRFTPINMDELPALVCNVDVLSPFEEVHNPVKELNPEKYGVFVVSNTKKSGLLLPDLEGVNSFEEQLYIACQKGNIDPDTESITIYRFSVVRYVEDASDTTKSP